MYADWLEEQGKENEAKWQRNLAALGGGFTDLDEPVKVDGFTITARLENDDDNEPPWSMCDGHGPVSEWTRRDKLPGERVLCEDHGSKRYYDFQAAVKEARKDGWDAPPYKTGTKGQQAVRAVEADFEYLRRWCNGDWRYVGVVLSVSRNGFELDRHAASLWGIESEAGEHLVDIANELLEEAVEVGRKALEEVNA